MEPIASAHNWELLIRREERGITLLRAMTVDECAVLPDTLFSLPVVALGDHALAPDARQPEGESVSLRCGRAEGEWNNRALRELTLPKQLRQADDYALYRCAALETLTVHGAVESWGSGVLMNCRALHRLLLKRDGGHWQETLSWFVSELSGELEVSVSGDGEPLHLIFPEFTESYEENCPAHHFDYVISGAGHPYHHVFRSGSVRPADYDALWTHFLETEHSADCALRLALARLLAPYALSAAARTLYTDYLQAHASEAFTLALTQRDGAALRLLLTLRTDSAALRHALSLSREAQWTEAQALLLERQRGDTPRGKTKTFAL